MLHYSEGDLVRRTGLLLGEVRALVQLASEALLPGPPLCPALDLYVREKALPHWGETGDHSRLTMCTEAIKGNAFLLFCDLLLL